MSRVMAIDYGTKRTGIAWSDPLGISVTPLGTFPTSEIKEKLKSWIQEGPVEVMILGWPQNLSGQDTNASVPVKTFYTNCQVWYPKLKIILWDERFTSRLAAQTLAQSGMSVSKRKEKTRIDTLSAVIMLQEYLSQPK
ncbi:MAG: Holliday junction resolvase RuvX [Sphingobacteriia bacterium]|nr:Holliday junction resolvase RuvX [Sphingobacteriia bacterium]